MTSIALVGANGQVGTEVCLLLSKMTGVTVLPIVRSRLGASVLERCGIPCRVGALTSDAEAKRLLEGCDLVADFSLPSGLPVQVRDAIRTNVTHAMRNAPAGARYVFMSSTMAFGNGTSGRYEDLWFARTPYAASKRGGERWARLMGYRYQRPTYVLRLGQVFGDLQSVSRAMISSPAQGRVALLDGQGGTSPSDAVFCSTIAQALVNIARGVDSPGRYTLLEAPEWTWQQLHAFHARQAGVQIEFVEPGAPAAKPTFARSLKAASSGLLRSAARELVRHKDLLVAQALPHYAGLELKIKTAHALRRARAEIRPSSHRDVFEVRCCRGPVPGRRLESLSASGRPSMVRELEAVRETLVQHLGAGSHNYH
ncbi:MAG: hypothetical protein JWN04_2691 [Myxococcaceae bacterium]|nr:hypothetical protein [Myxococcaceae bacterium]